MRNRGTELERSTGGEGPDPLPGVTGPSARKTGEDGVPVAIDKVYIHGLHDQKAINR